MTERLSVCFVWHMHQPLYKDRGTGHYILPWVRLHGVKDYLDMALILDDFPRIHQTFNLVASLIEQLEDYAWHEAVDQQLLLTIKPQKDFTQADKTFLIKECFHANLERQIEPHPHYFALYAKRHQLLKNGGTYSSITAHFSEQEYADMAAWFNLAWFDPLFFERKPHLKKMIKKGQSFTLPERIKLIETQREILQEVVPVYKRLQECGQIEITTSPYYHPILPLLIDSSSALVANAYTKMPERSYFHREDAEHQINTAQSFYARKFGQNPRGFWPSELAASPASLELIAKCGSEWVALDESLLAKTLDKPVKRDEHGNLNDAEMLCQPYRLCLGAEEINVLFRESTISNEISFSFGSRDAVDAASALCMRLKHIQQRLFNWPREGVVVIALDGENCWEGYEADGGPFLKELYRRLSEDPTLHVRTVSEYLSLHPPTEELHRIGCGSWINSDYHIWIGDRVKNKAWDLLAKTRRFLVLQLKKKRYSKDVIVRAWEEIYAAEGSDWFWWFGEPNNSQHDATFDLQFRLRLQNVYSILGQECPQELRFAVPDLDVRHEIAIASRK